VEIGDWIVDELAHRLTKLQGWVAGIRDVVNHLFWGRSNRISGDVVYKVVLSDTADELTEIEI
jgi:hypothetical protein